MQTFCCLCRTRESAFTALWLWRASWSFYCQYYLYIILLTLTRFCNAWFSHCGSCWKKWHLADLDLCSCGRDPDDVLHCRLMPSFDKAGWWFVQTSLCRWYRSPLAGKHWKVNPRSPAYDRRSKSCCIFRHTFVVLLHYLVKSETSPFNTVHMNFPQKAKYTIEHRSTIKKGWSHLQGVAKK